MAPAIRAFLALSAGARGIMDLFLEIVPGVPLTQGLRDTLAADSDYCTKPKVWQFRHTRHPRASRKNGVEETHVTHELYISADIANQVLPPAIQAQPHLIKLVTAGIAFGMRQPRRPTSYPGWWRPRQSSSGLRPASFAVAVTSA